VNSNCKSAPPEVIAAATKKYTDDFNFIDSNNDNMIDGEEILELYKYYNEQKSYDPKIVQEALLKM